MRESVLSNEPEAKSRLRSRHRLAVRRVCFHAFADEAGEPGARSQGNLAGDLGRYSPDPCRRYARGDSYLRGLRRPLAAVRTTVARRLGRPDFDGREGGHLMQCPGAAGGVEREAYV